MHERENRQIRLAARPVGLPKRSDWSFTTERVRAPEPGEVTVEVRYVSLDPAMRGWTSDAPSYIAPVALGAVMRAGGAGIVIASACDGFAPGDYVSGAFGVQAFATLAGDGLAKIDPSIAPLPVWLNVLGMPGIAAYFGVLDVGRVRAGETVVVSGAAGAVGATAGQIAKIAGARTVGIAGGPEKCAYLLSLGFDAAVDYKAGDLAVALKEHAPTIDVYFDNVGGDTLDAALARLALRGRVVLCGAISQYNAARVRGPSNYLALLKQRGRMEGLIVFDYAARYGEAIAALCGWLRAGTLRSREDVVVGLETFPETLNMLFSGTNFGKLVIKVAPD